MSDDSGFHVPPELRTGALGDYFDRVSPTWFDHYVNNLASLFGEPTPLDQVPKALGGTRPAGQFSLTRDTEPSPLDALLIRKASAIIEVPVDLLMDTGAIPDTRVPNKPYRPPLRQRIQAWRERIAYRAFKAIAGYGVPDREE
jgi:hypothetical protein